ncbi:MAG: hypothetical protein P8129_06770 [Anaerolineae bacterium]
MTHQEEPVTARSTEAQLLHDLCRDERGINPETLEQTLVLAVEIAREGREGRKIGTMFVVSDAIAVVVSESAIVRLFDDGEIVAEILPELWLLSRHGLHIKEPYRTHFGRGMTVAQKQE